MHRLALLVAISLVSVTASADDHAVYVEKILPLLEERCYSCHSHAARKSRGGLAVDSRAALLTGGESGPAIVPGKPEESLLIEAVKRTGLEMPPAGKGDPLTPDEIAVLESWIRAGAPAPESADPAGPKKRRPGVLTEADRQWWAIQPLKAVEPLHVEGVAHPIDRFIRDRLEREGLSPAPEADAQVLSRRVTFDLIGLPPTPGNSGDYERLVDELLASPRYGERMARHWLDLVRYADSDGYRIDDYRPDAWRYRDYVIRAFNDDKPYDRFVQEQLAGDELFPGDIDALIATGYLRHWIYEYNNRDVRGQWTTILNDLTDTTGDVFFGVGLQCARCHDHKFDPILQKDYYRLQAYFAAILPKEDLVAATPEQRAEHAAAVAEWEAATTDLRAEIAELEQKYRHKAAESAITKFPEDIQAMIRRPADQRTPLETQIAALAWRQVEYEWNRLDTHIKGEDKERVLALRKQLAAFDKQKPVPLPIAFAVTEVGPTAPAVYIPKKGDAPVDPGVLTLLDAAPATIEQVPQSPHTTGRRAALARWLTDPQNPLTARIIVNRVWQQHFGRGLAANCSDFGTLGEPPTHPELLDWLAGWFIREGWSLKKLHRLIVTSATYRQSSRHPQPDAGQLQDPENKLLWRARPRRLEAEQIRDALFAVTGELQLKTGGPGSMATEPRRSIYTRIMRNTRDPLIDAFDAPLWFTSASSRDTTTTPIQSLLLVNSAFMLQRGRALADRVEQLSPDSEAGQVAAAYRCAFSREPTSSEREAALHFLSEQRRRVNTKMASSDQAKFTPEKIPFRDGQAALIEPSGQQRMFRASESSTMQPEGDFTVEAFVLPRTIADDGAVRVIAAKWSGEMKQSGWCFGITGKGSRRKPQTVVLQMVGRKRDGSTGEVVAFSDQHIALLKPYYLAVSLRLATPAENGTATFYLKDLSNDDEPLQVATVTHQLAGGLTNGEPFTIGGRSGRSGSYFHGAIDDVRFSRGALDVPQLLYHAEAVTGQTRGYWRFEARPDVLSDASEQHHDLEPVSTTGDSVLTARAAALADFCQALLNSTEFLYVE